MKLPSLDAEWR